MEKKIIYVCCGTGIATSTVIAKKIKPVLDENNIPYEITQYTVQEVASKITQKRPDIIITSTTITGNVGEVPVVLGRSFLTNMGKKQTIEEIISILKQ